MVQGMSGQRRIEHYFSVYFLYSFVSEQDSGLQIVGHMQRERADTQEPMQPIHNLTDT